ncbi:MAG: hypothetical protein LBV77_01795 [Candidatus Adiutrix intracellularis]|nr:hypothetical protein [Candidatus Adiutrix intracellularis]
MTSMKNVVYFKTGEGGFWEYLYFDLVVESGGLDQVLIRHLSLLDCKAILAVNTTSPEFVGRLVYFPSFKKLAPNCLINFISQYIKPRWPSQNGHPHKLVVRCLSGNIFFNVRMFKLSLLNKILNAAGRDLFSVWSIQINFL